MHDLVIDNAVVYDGLGGPPREGGVAVSGAQLTWDPFATPPRTPRGSTRWPWVFNGVWINGVRTVDERGPITACGRPGRVLREFRA